MFHKRLMAAMAAVAFASAPVVAAPVGDHGADGVSDVTATAVPSSALPGLRTGLDVRSVTGTNLGTVDDVVTGPDGSIRQVIVKSSNGATFQLEAATLSMSGNVVVTGTAS